MKKRVYILACVGIMVVGASVFLVARLTVTRRGEIRKLLAQGNLSFDTLRDLYNEIVRSGETGGDIEMTIKRKMGDAELEERVQNLEAKREGIEKQIRDVDASLVEEEVPEEKE